MKIIDNECSIGELKKIAENTFVDMVKAVVDVRKEIIAVDAQMYCDLEEFLLDNGSNQNDLWGVNFYVDIEGEDFVEFDSMINLRPLQENMTRGVDDEGIRKEILEIVHTRIRR